MDIKIRMGSGSLIRDNSGDYACPNLNCWRENRSRVRPGDEKCPKCGVFLDWHWIEDDLAWKRKHPRT